MDIKPIHSAADHKAALAEIERLWGARPGTPDGDKFEVLATLVDEWERKHTPILPPDPIEAIKFRLEQQGQTRKALERILGTRARVSEVLNRRRKLTLAMIRALHRDLDIPLEILVADDTVRKTKRSTRPARRASSAKAHARSTRTSTSRVSPPPPR